MQTPNTYEVKKLKGIPKVMSCLLQHKCVETTAKLTWTGPKLNAIWPEIMAFFRWTYDTTHSESQVRLFVNHNLQEWKAWAFPQKAKTGMSARELDEKDDGYDIAQRAQFDDTWHYWGTVHHHCSAQAFQSSTDTANERNQDGIHITVGNVDKEQCSIHYRVYVDGFELTSVKLTEFWDIGSEVINTIPVHLRRYLQASWMEDLARVQMGIQPPKDQEINQQWKDNIIDVNPPVSQHVATITPTGQMSFDNGPYHRHYSRAFWTMRSRPNLAYDLKRAAYDLIELIKDPQASDLKGIEDAVAELKYLSDTMADSQLNLLDVCCRNDVLPNKLMEFIEAQLESIKVQCDPEVEEAKGKKGKKGKATKQEILGIEDKAAWESEGGYYMGHMGS